MRPINDPLKEQGKRKSGSTCLGSKGQRQTYITNQGDAANQGEIHKGIHKIQGILRFHEEDREVKLLYYYSIAKASLINKDNTPT